VNLALATPLISNYSVLVNRSIRNARESAYSAEIFTHVGMMRYACTSGWEFLSGVRGTSKQFSGRLCVHVDTCVYTSFLPRYYIPSPLPVFPQPCLL
jgi:hypothetical protein